MTSAGALAPTSPVDVGSRALEAYGLRFIVRRSDDENTEPTGRADSDTETVVVSVCRHSLKWPADLESKEPRDRRARTRYWLRRGGGLVGVRYEGGLEALVAPDRVAMGSTAGFVQGELDWHLVGPLAVLVLWLRGELLLHGSAVRLGRSGLACVGPSGVGKSTLAAKLVARGATPVVDDLLVMRTIGEAPAIEWGPNRMLLWPDTARQFGLDTDSPYRWDKLEVATKPCREQSATNLTTIDKIALLEPTDDEELRLEPVDPMAAVIRLLGERRGPWHDERLTTLDFERIANLVDRTEVRRLIYPRRFESLEKVAARVEAWL